MDPEQYLALYKAFNNDSWDIDPLKDRVCVEFNVPTFKAWHCIFNFTKIGKNLLIYPESLLYIKNSP